MEQEDIIKKLKEHFKTLDNPVLKFIDYSKNTDTLVVKGTIEEWRKFFDGHK